MVEVSLVGIRGRREASVAGSMRLRNRLRNTLGGSMQMGEMKAEDGEVACPETPATRAKPSACLQPMSD